MDRDFYFFKFWKYGIFEKKLKNQPNLQLKWIQGLC